MSTAARVIYFRLPNPKIVAQRREPASSPEVKLGKDDLKIMLQPRLCTLRSYGSNRFEVVKRKNDGGGKESPFFEKLYEYLENSRKSQDFEIISGRLAMVVFAATVTMEAVTGNSLFRKMDLQGITEAAGLCLGAVTFAAIFALLSSARSKVGNVFTLSRDTFIDSLVDQIIDGLFYDSSE